MPQSFVTLLGALVAGAMVALSSLHMNFPAGWIGGLALIGMVLLARQRWAKLEATTGLEPGAPERMLRVHAIGTALLFGHLLIAIGYPDIDLHVGNGNYLAIDSWTMILALLITIAISRHDGKVKDERDLAIMARGTKAGFLSLVASLVILAFALAFLPPSQMAVLSHFMIGNILIAAIVAALLVKYTVQLFDYAKDTNVGIAMVIDQ